MPTIGVDIYQYILLIFYPSIVFFIVGYVAKKRSIKKPIIYLIQSIVCFIFSNLPHGTKSENVDKIRLIRPKFPI